jgi:hypothetical protein
MDARPVLVMVNYHHYYSHSYTLSILSSANHVTLLLKAKLGVNKCKLY